MDQLIAQVARSIRSRGLLKTRERVLVAVSGGADSMALLAILHQLAPKADWRLTVAHFNHHLRGRASGADERLVCRRAKELGLTFVSGAGDVRAEAKRRGVSVEMAARDLRHRFFIATARCRRIRTIALAHHADDQAELFLLRLLRGTSAEGLAGMTWAAPSPFAAGLQLIRPLLEVSKSELLDFVGREGLAFREDASNASLDHLRNRIRHDLLPRLERDFQPGVRAVIARLAELLADDAEFVGEQAARWRNARRLADFKKLPRTVQRRVLVEELIANGLTPEFDLIEQLRTLPNRRISVASNRCVSRDDAGRIQLTRELAADFQPNESRLIFRNRKGTTTFGEVQVSWTVEKSGAIPGGIQFGKHWMKAARPASEMKAWRMECFDVDQVGRRILLRHWRAGDRFQPIGMPRPVKLQDLFTNAKVSAGERRQRVVAEAESGDLFWVEGLRIGERFKLDTGTQRRLKWCWQRQ